MNTPPLNDKPSGNGSGTKWTRASIVAAAVAGALTAEGANLLYAQLTPEPEPTPEPQPAHNPNSSISSSHAPSHTSEHLSLL